MLGFFGKLTLALLLASFATPTFAEYPDRPIKMIVPFPAGGGTDYSGRIMAKYMAERLKQAIYVDNRAGANGIVGLQALKQATADGYTIATASDGPLIYNRGLYKDKLPYDTLKDFVPIAMVMKLPAVMVVHPSVPVKTIGELIALAKEKPGQLNYASAGVGNFSHLGMELFMQATGIKLQHIPYTGTAPANQAALAGNVQVTFNNLESLMPTVLSGQLRALGVGEPRRVNAFPDIPTIGETVPGFAMAAWTGLVAPAGTPKEIVARLAKEAEAVLADPEVLVVLEKQHVIAAPVTLDAFAAFIATENEKWGKVIDSAGIKLQQ